MHPINTDRQWLVVLWFLLGLCAIGLIALAEDPPAPPAARQQDGD